MSMYGHLYLLPAEDLEAAFEDPTKVHALVSRAYKADATHSVDLMKHWHALHFLLTGSAWEGDPPLNFVATGGTQVGEEDVGYGPARGFLPEEVSAIADALEPLTARDMVAQFDGALMDKLEVYPSRGWAEIDPTDPDLFGAITEAFDEARALSRRGREQGLAMLAWIS